MSIPLEIVNLSKTYDSKEAVQNISFKVKKNKIIGILGPNGCGKTTTIGMILGLLKPTKGKVLINGMEIEKQRGISVSTSVLSFNYQGKKSFYQFSSKTFCYRL